MTTNPGTNLRALPAYLVFEGGGAKGYAYIGAMRALEDKHNINKLGVAGTSAGAFTAALVAAGFTSQELFDWSKPKGSRGVLEEGLARFFVNDKVRTFLRAIKSLQLSAREDYRHRTFFPRIAGCLTARYHYIRGLIALTRTQRHFAREQGLVDLSAFRNWLNTLLQVKLGKATGDVLFSDLPYDLKIIATNVTHHSMVVYERPQPRNGHQEFSVADAVCASIAIPFVFKPIKLQPAQGPGALQIDGGITSNFPYWVFEDSRGESFGHKDPIIAIRLADTKQELQQRTPDYPATLLGTFNFATDVLASAISGSDTPDRLPIRNIHIVTLEVPVSTLAFERADTQLEAIATEANRQMVRWLRKQPHLGPASVVQEALEISVAALRNLFSVPEAIRLRANVMLPVSPSEHMVYFSFNMDEHTDDRLTLPLKSGVAAMCYDDRTPKVVILQNPGEGGLNKYQKALVWPDIKTIFAIPLFSPDVLVRVVDRTARTTFGVLNFDSDSDLSPYLKSPDVAQRFAAQVSQLVSRALYPVMSV